MRFRVALLCLLTALRSFAAESPRLAVLEFDAPENAVSFEALQLLTNELRAAVIDSVGLNYSVMTRENMDVLLPADQLKAARCDKDLCVAEIGRRLQAAYVISGTVRRLDAELALSLEAYETASGRALGAQQFFGAKARDLINDLRKQAPGLVVRWLRTTAVVESPRPVPPPEPAPPALPTWSVSFESVPSGARVQLGGRDLCAATPCTRSVLAGSHAVAMSLAGYEDARAEVAIGRGQRRVLLTLESSAPLFEAPMPRVEARPGGRCPASMALIPGGSFLMGSNDGEPDERPVHRVSVRTFCLDRTEASGADGLPITNVSWDEASAACRRQGARLPTEAEWEFAARGAEGRRYPWGNAQPTCARANSFECGRALRPGGAFPAGATPDGVHDLAGNVWEWVEDGYAETYDDRPHPTRHVVRGGSFSRDIKLLRAADRNWNPAVHRGPGLGYRCAREPLR